MGPATAGFPTQRRCGASERAADEQMIRRGVARSDAPLGPRCCVLSTTVVSRCSVARFPGTERQAPEGGRGPGLVALLSRGRDGWSSSSSSRAGCLSSTAATIYRCDSRCGSGEGRGTRASAGDGQIMTGLAGEQGWHGDVATSSACLWNPWELRRCVYVSCTRWGCT